MTISSFHFRSELHHDLYTDKARGHSFSDFQSTPEVVAFKMVKNLGDLALVYEELTEPDILDDSDILLHDFYFPLSEVSPSIVAQA